MVLDWEAVCACEREKKDLCARAKETIYEKLGKMKKKRKKCKYGIDMVCRMRMRREKSKHMKRHQLKFE